MLLFQVDGGALDSRRGVVYQDVEPAELALDLSEQRLDSGRVSQVRLDPEAANAKGLDLPLSLGRRLVTAIVVEGDVGAPAAKLEGDSPAYAARAAGNERYFALELITRPAKGALRVRTE